MSASAVILGHRRVGNLSKIVANLASHAFVTECRVWLNDPLPEVAMEIVELESDLPQNWLQVTISPQNAYTYGRFVWAYQAKNDIILSCDDDVLVYQWREIYERHLETNRLVTTLDRGHCEWAKSRYAHPYDGGMLHETMLGWGSAWRRSWIDRAFRDYIAWYGVDETLIRKADRLFTMLLEQKHETLVSNIQHLTGAGDPDCLSNQRDHWSANRLAYDHAKFIANKRLTNSPQTV